MTIRSIVGSQAMVIVPTRNSSVIGASSGSVSLGLLEPAARRPRRPLRRSTSSSTLSQVLGQHRDLLLLAATLVIRLPSRACRKNVRSPG